MFLQHIPIFFDVKFAALYLKINIKVIIMGSIIYEVDHMKRLMCFILAWICLFSVVSCGNGNETEVKKELCSWYWESVVDILQFTEDGKILRNFEPDHESDSRYKIEKDSITMYTDGNEQDGITFKFRLDKDKLYIGEAEYTKYRKVKNVGSTDKE